MNKQVFSAWVVLGAITALPFSVRADNRSFDGNAVPPPAERTATDQSNDPTRVETTRRIRERIVNDKSLSTSAHNVTIVTTKDGEVTIRGLVTSTIEKDKIMQIANAVVPGVRINDQMSIKNQ